jgi:hypothetical protein
LEDEAAKVRLKASQTARVVCGAERGKNARIDEEERWGRWKNAAV